MKYNKLVRDKIPQIIEEKGQIAIIKIANQKEYEKKLNEKLMEEVKEFLKAKNKEEFVDILEVLNAIGAFYEFDKTQVDQLRKEKAMKKGSFQERIILEEVINGKK